MENDILFLSAPLFERIWGGNYFKDVLKVTDSNEKIGEMWTASAYKGGESIILNGQYKNQSLDKVFTNHKELFDNSSLDEFPILVKVIAASDDLSVQVHPNDKYAKENENGVGKTEGWLILDCNDDSYIILGHNAKTKEELENYVKKDEYDTLLNKRYVKKGEFYPIPSGTIHAIGKNIVLLEVQQSSNITYRFYDYHRKDKNGNERELHVKKALDVTNIEPYDLKINNCFKDNIKCIWDNNYFMVDLYDVKGTLELTKNNEYLICSVIEGNIEVDSRIISLGDSFIITSIAKKIILKGNGKIVITKSKI